MINVSSEFREIMEKRRNFMPYADIEFQDGRRVSLEPKDFVISGNSITDAAESNSLPLGVAIGKSLTFSILNDKDQYADYDFMMCEVKMKLKFQLSNSVETVYKGKYTMITPETYGSTIEITAVDDMYKADVNYDSSLTYPATANEILRDACERCDIPLLTTTIPNGNTIIKKRPDGTYRDVIGNIAMIAAGNARIDVDGYLSVIPYDLSVFDDEESQEKRIHHIKTLKNINVDFNDIIITGVQTKIKNSSGSESTYLVGEKGYVLEVENPLIEGIENSVLNYIGSRLIGLQFRKVSASLFSDPTIECFDPAYVTDRKGTYQTFFTDVDFGILSYTDVSNSAESPLRNSRNYQSNTVKAIIEARKNTDDALSEYDKVVEQVTGVIANSMGIFRTIEKTENGGRIVYQHDKPKLEDSMIIWKKTEKGFKVSTDGGKTWNAGIDSNGNAFLNLLAVVGFYFDWAKGGTLTLGGLDNVSGILRILNSAGKTVVKGSDEGLNIYGGTLNGWEITEEGLQSVSDDGTQRVLLAKYDPTGKRKGAIYVQKKAWQIYQAADDALWDKMFDWETLTRIDYDGSVWFMSKSYNGTDNPNLKPEDLKDFKDKNFVHIKNGNIAGGTISKVVKLYAEQDVTTEYYMSRESTQKGIGLEIGTTATAQENGRGGIRLQADKYQFGASDNVGKNATFSFIAPKNAIHQSDGSYKFTNYRKAELVFRNGLLVDYTWNEPSLEGSDYT